MVDSAIVICRCVQVPTQAMSFAGNLTDMSLFSTFEEHVLDDVRDTGDPVVFIEIPRLHVGTDADKRHGLLFSNENCQPVLKDDLRSLSLIFSKRVGFHDLCHLEEKD